MNLIDATELAGTNGAIWGTETEDLDATIVRWEPNLGVTTHANDEVDVVMTILCGGGLAIVNSEPHVLVTGQILVIPKGTSREIKANSEGITYLNVHKRRKKLLPNMVRPKN